MYTVYTYKCMVLANPTNLPTSGKKGMVGYQPRASVVFLGLYVTLVVS
jgi:hypothetical protein